MRFRRTSATAFVDTISHIWQSHQRFLYLKPKWGPKCQQSKKKPKNVNDWNELSLKISIWFPRTSLCAILSFWKVLLFETAFFRFCPKCTTKTVEKNTKKLYFRQNCVFSVTWNFKHKHCDVSPKPVWASDWTRKSVFLTKKMVEASNRTWKSGNKRLSLKGSFCNVFKLDPEETNAFLASTRHFRKKRVRESDSTDAQILFSSTYFFLFSFQIRLLLRCNLQLDYSTVSIE